MGTTIEVNDLKDLNGGLSMLVQPQTTNQRFDPENSHFPDDPSLRTLQLIAGLCSSGAWKCVIWDHCNMYSMGEKSAEDQTICETAGKWNTMHYDYRSPIAQWLDNPMFHKNIQEWEINVRAHFAMVIGNLQVERAKWDISRSDQNLSNLVPIRSKLVWSRQFDHQMQPHNEQLHFYTIFTAFLNQKQSLTWISWNDKSKKVTSYHIMFTRQSSENPQRKNPDRLYIL